MDLNCSAPSPTSNLRDCFSPSTDRRPEDESGRTDTEPAPVSQTSLTWCQMHRWLLVYCSLRSSGWVDSTRHGNHLVDKQCQCRNRWLHLRKPDHLQRNVTNQSGHLEQLASTGWDHQATLVESVILNRSKDSHIVEIFAEVCQDSTGEYPEDHWFEHFSLSEIVKSETQTNAICILMNYSGEK